MGLNEAEFRCDGAIPEAVKNARLDLKDGLLGQPLTRATPLPHHVGSVVLASTQKKMVGVAAGGHVTPMADEKLAGMLAAEMFVGAAVDQFGSAPAPLDAAIAFWANGARPQPATSVRVVLDPISKKDTEIGPGAARHYQALPATVAGELGR
jgi:hypothetical protein